MKSATVTELRNNFTEVSKWIRAGESVTITHRGRAFARLQPTDHGDKPEPVDLAARLRALFPGGPVKGDITKILDEDRSR